MLTISPLAYASLVTVSGEFLTFSASSVVVPNNATVNSIALTDTVPASARTDTLNLSPGTDKVDFTYFGDNSPTFFNSFSFASGAPADVNVGDSFNLGTFTFTNGFGFQETEVTFKLITHSIDLALDNHVFTGTMNLVVNTGSTDPYLAADYFFIAERPDLGSARVFDLAFQPSTNPGNTGTFDIFGNIGSLIPNQFVATNDAGFVSSKIGPLSPSDIPGATPLSLPATWALIVAGVAGFLFSRRFSGNRARSLD